MSDFITLNTYLLRCINDRKVLNFRSKVTSEKMKQHLDKVILLGGKAGLLDCTVNYDLDAYIVSKSSINANPSTSSVESIFDRPIKLKPYQDFFKSIDNKKLNNEDRGENKDELPSSNMYKLITTILPDNDETDLVVITEILDQLTLLSNRKFSLPIVCSCLFTGTHFKSINISDVYVPDNCSLKNMFYLAGISPEINIRNLDINSEVELNKVLNKCNACKIIVNSESYNKIRRDCSINTLRKLNKA